MQEKYVIYKTKNIFYRKYGSGKPVMLVHGFGEDGNIWSNQIAFLQNNFLLLVPDLPGSGKSEMLTENNIAITDYAEVLLAILTEEKITQCCIIGHSMGGYIALAFAKKYPDFLNALGLVHSTAYADTEIKITTRKKAIEFIQANGSQAFLKTSTPNLFWDKEKNKEAIENLIAEGNNFSQAALVQYYHAMINREETTEVLKTFTKPILFIIGQYDDAVPFADSMQQTYLPSYAYIHILRNAAHMGILEEKEKTNNILADFLESI
jgi:pimeloyl-ACP methyl ester carboxylesterase